MASRIYMSLVKYFKNKQNEFVKIFIKTKQ